MNHRALVPDHLLKRDAFAEPFVGVLVVHPGWVIVGNEPGDQPSLGVIADVIVEYHTRGDCGDCGRAFAGP